MRFVSYQSPTGPRVAAVGDDRFVDLNRADPALPASMIELLSLGADGLRKATAAAAGGDAFPRNTVKVLAPIPRPEKVICVGLNYADHARETGKDLPSEPVIFNKFVTAVSSSGEPIVLPKVTRKVDYEAELVVVIGRGGRHIAREAALEHVAGYCCGNDVSARDWQTGKPAGQWLLGKSFDTFAPMGPELVTADEIGDPGNLRVQLRLNGATMQDSSTKQFIFSVPELIAYISGVCTLHTGDVLFTGTPPGVGVARKPPVYLQPGDQVEVEIERIGILRNPVVAETKA
jgi:2-keto-4-pentenoate hydratase/2-oxohepta-3-ene-1,7-dioic acid hydratase in catechol pathway